MIPYFEIPSVPLFGPFQIHPFGVLVATAVLVGGSMILRFGRQQGQNEDELRGAITWGIVCGFIGAHLMAILIYFPERIGDEGVIVLFKIWDGISSFGGFFGAFVGLWIYYKRLGKPWLVHADVIIQGFAIAWFFGRAACFVAFDHPGNETEFFLGQMYRDGVVRHNLGLYEMLWVVVAVWPAMFVARRFKPRPGIMSLVICVAYAPGRFYFDSLRGIDAVTENSTTRLMGLTPGQLSAFGILALGILSYRNGRNWKEKMSQVKAATAPVKVEHHRAKKKGNKKKKRR
jgi:phosphatidylglycerol:prolipoprotein diacylglycerol transferase